MDMQKTLEWLAEVSEQAITEARSGNALPANKMSGNPALAHYLNNVVGTGALRPTDWARCYPPMLAEADALREASERAVETEEHTDRITSLEAKLETMAGMIEQLVEVKSDAKPKRKRKAAPKAKLAEAEEVEAEAEVDATSEPEAETPDAKADVEADETEDAGDDEETTEMPDDEDNEVA